MSGARLTRNCSGCEQQKASRDTAARGPLSGKDPKDLGGDDRAAAARGEADEAEAGDEHSPAGRLGNAADCRAGTVGEDVVKAFIRDVTAEPVVRNDYRGERSRRRQAEEAGRRDATARQREWGRVVDGATRQVDRIRIGGVGIEIVEAERRRRRVEVERQRNDRARAGKAGVAVRPRQVLVAAADERARDRRVYATTTRDTGGDADIIAIVLTSDTEAVEGGIEHAGGAGENPDRCSLERLGVHRARRRQEGGLVGIGGLGSLSGSAD